MNFYYALWIPTLKKGNSNPQILNKKPGEKKLQDLPSQQALIIKGEISFDSYDITLKYKHTQEREFKELSFQKQTLTHEGILIYKLELDEERIQNDYVCQRLSHEMHKALYHYIKGFFHKHMFHADKEDSLLPAFFSTEEIQWEQSTTKRLILQPIVTNYAIKFSGYLKEWEHDLNQALAEISKNKNITKNISLLRNIIQTSHNIFGEAQYCEFLLQHFPTEISSKDKKEIRETVYSLKSLYENITFWHNLYTSKISFIDGRNGVKLGVWGIIIGVASIILALYLEYNSPDAIKLKTNTIHHIDSLHQDTQLQLNSQMQFLQMQNDSIWKMLREVNKKMQRPAIKQQNKTSNK